MQDRYRTLTDWSKRLHGHQTILPVAVWIDENGIELATPPEVDRGLQGAADRARVIEALVRLAEIGALRELPRVGPPNATRYFERVPSPYWTFLETYLVEIGLAAPEKAST